MEILNLDRLRHLEHLGRQQNGARLNSFAKAKSRQSLLLEKSALEDRIRQDFLRLCKQFMTEVRCNSFLIKFGIEGDLNKMSRSLSINPVAATFESPDGAMQYRFRDTTLLKDGVPISLSEISIFIQVFAQVHQALKTNQFHTLRME